MAQMLFPTYTDIAIESITNDEMTLTPSEYYFIQGRLKEELYVRRRGIVERRKETPRMGRSSR